MIVVVVVVVGCVCVCVCDFCPVTLFTVDCSVECVV